MKSLVIGALSLALAALGSGCGDNIHPGGGTDAGKTNDATVPMDAPSDGGMPGITCDYTEMDDGSNDYTVSATDVEETGLTYTGTAITICGIINNNHFDPSEGKIDVDDYHVTIGSDADVLVTLVGSGAELISQVGIFAYDDQSNENLGGGYFQDHHGAFTGHLPAGIYEMSMEAYDNHDSAAPIPYRMTIWPDNPQAECGAATGSASYTEMHDLTNDYIEVNYTPDPTSITQIAGDSPENTGLTFGSGSNYLITGTAAQVHLASASYYDADTYLITAGSDTNQLRVRLDWPDSDLNLDYYVFPANLPATIVGLTEGTNTANGVAEYETTSVTPGNQYLLWVGAATAPIYTNNNYSLTVCAQNFSIPQ